MENTQNFSEEIQKMRHLMNFGLNENASKGTAPIVEFHQKAADGKTYGIIREGQKFYIKVAPKKDTEVLSEDYDYIGGFMNKKDYEYTNYATASKQFDLKIQSINEACGKANAVATQQFKQPQPAEWQVNETKEARQDLNMFNRRFNQLLNNVDYILSENKEGKALDLGDPNISYKSGNPFTEDPFSNEKVNGMKENETDPKKADKTFSTKGEYKTDPKGKEHKDAKTADSTYCDKSAGSKVPSKGTSVAAAKGSTNKNTNGVKGVNESKGRTFRMTESQVLAWSKDPNFMDTTKGTEIGDTAPYDEKASVKEAIHNSEDMDQHTAKYGDTDPYTSRVNEDEMDNTSMLVDNDGAGSTETEYEIDLDEAVLNDFGKHPAYRKQPLTTPPTTEIDRWGRDWNDDSAKGSEPFGTKIGHSGDPFVEKAIDMLTDNIVSRLKKKI